MRNYQINGTKNSAYHCECSPAFIVRHSLKTIFNGNKPDLLISGINCGENIGSMLHALAPLERYWRLPVLE